MFTLIKNKKNECNHYTTECEHDTLSVDTQNEDREEVRISRMYGLLVLISIPIVYRLILYFT